VVTAQTGPRSPIPNIQQLSTPTSAVNSAIANAVGNVNTAFLTQQGSAFVSAPANPAPDQPGGGIWVRGVGGHVDINSTSTSNIVATIGGAPVYNGTTNCANQQRSDFVGGQIGADIARLNLDGWNVHLGTTAGYLRSKSTDSFGFDSRVDVPYLGTYLVVTKGRFFADVLVRREFYNIELNNLAFNYFNQPVGAHGLSVSASTGYNFDLGQNWFAEPSGGYIYSRTTVDNFVNPGTAALAIPGLVTTNDVESSIGRLSLRVGRTVETPNVILQPFASASVFHEFGANVTGSYNTLSNGAFFGDGTPTTISQQTSTSRIGTYGQYSLGVAAQVINTGWLGFVRVDYRRGENLEGWTGNAGLRYQFTPETVASILPTKAKGQPYIAPTNWTGFYVGGFAGVGFGTTGISFVGDPVAGARTNVLGGLVGGQVGFNQQINNWVLGVEGDIGAANIRGGRAAGTATGLNNAGGNAAFSPAFFTVQDDTNWMATATGRVGYAWNRTLIYVKGGAAFEDGNVSAACIYGSVANQINVGRGCFNQAVPAFTAGFSTPQFTRVGWTLGYGTEFDLGKNWSAKAEYDYISFGGRTARASDGTTQLTDRADISQVKVGVNYRFAPSPVVARY
jgi:opacity protein-like surface antigen